MKVEEPAGISNSCWSFRSYKPSFYRYKHFLFSDLFDMTLVTAPILWKKL